MPSFILETYVTGLTPIELDELAERTKHAATGTAVVHVRSYFVPEDEMCMHVFEAPSREAVEELASAAGLEVERVIHTVGEHAEQSTGRET